MAKYGMKLFKDPVTEKTHLRDAHDRPFLKEEDDTEMAFDNPEAALDKAAELFVIGEVYPPDGKRIVESGRTTDGYAFTTG